MTRKRTPLFDAKIFLSLVGSGKTILKTKKNQIIFSQGDTSDAVFYILGGQGGAFGAVPKRGSSRNQVGHSVVRAGVNALSGTAWREFKAA